MQLDPQSQTVVEAFGQYDVIVESVLHHRTATFADFRAGRITAGSRFFAMTYDEIDAHFVAEREELDRYAVVNLVAAAEAAIRLDYRDRIRHNFKDALSKIYQNFHKGLSVKAKVRPPFDESGILDQIKSSTLVPAHIVTTFRQVLRYRHWIAHGRYWAEARINATSLTPQDALVACNDFLAALPK